MNKGIKYGVALLLGTLMASNAVLAAEVSEEEKNICIETVKELAGGKPAPKAIKLCQEGKTDAAIEAAMIAAEGG